MGTANFTILYLCEMKGKCTIETAGQAVDESGKSVRTIVHAHSGTYVGWEKKTRWFQKHIYYKCNIHSTQTMATSKHIHTDTHRGGFMVKALKIAFKL